MTDVSGYRKVRASELSREQQEQLRLALQHDLTEAMVQAVRENPPEVDLTTIDVILSAGIASAAGVLADCGTCGTCATCVTCVTH